MNITKTFLSYNVIELRVYIKIQNTSDLSLLQLTGSYDAERCIEVWEEIVKQSSEANNNYLFASLFNIQKTAANHIAEYTTVKIMLLKLALQVDLDMVKYLNKLGYKISIRDGVSYAESLMAAQRKVENLVTKARLKQNELDTSYTENKTKPETFEDIMANLIGNLGFTVPDDITLARYNAYKKIIKAKHQAAKLKK